MATSKFTIIGQQRLDNKSNKIFRCRIAGQVLGALKTYLLQRITVGVSLIEIDRMSYYFIARNRCKPSFLNYLGYPNTICASVNRVLIHAIPSAYVLRENDILTIDVGCSYMGYHADFAFTIIIPGQAKKKLLPTPTLNSDGTMALVATKSTANSTTKLPISKSQSLLERKERILRVTQLVIDEAIKIIRPNINLQQLSSVIYDTITKNGYFTPKEFCGHGIGQKLHEEPYVGNIAWQSPDLYLKAGMIICVEPMLIEFSADVILASDNWTVIPADKRALSCHLEHTILVTQESNEVLTKSTRESLIKNILEKYDI